MRRKLLSLLLALVAIIVIIGCSSSVQKESTTDDTEDKSDGETVELSISHAFPSTHPIETEIIQPWANEIKEKSDGRVNIKSYPVGTLLESEQIYDGVVNGVSDMGVSFFSYTPGRFPLMTLIELAGLPIKNSKVGTTIGMDILKEFNLEEIHDTEVLLVATTGSAYLITKDPVKDLDDIKGMEIRTTGASAGGVETLGGTPISMPMPEAYEALSRGLADGILGAPEIIQGFKLDEVTDYITETPFLYNGLLFLTINSDTWDSIPDDLKDIIEQENTKLHEEVIPGFFDGANESAMQYGIDNSGMEFITLSEDEVEKWMDLLKDYQEEHITQLESEGLNAAEVLDRIKELTDEYNEIY